MTYYKNRRYTKRYRKKKKRSNWNVTQGKGLTPSLPLGKTFKMTMRYCESAISLNPGIGGLPANYVFSLNGLYDPNYTGTGHQPLGYDQIMTMYDHYTVIGARIRVNFMNNDATYGQTVALHIKDSPAATTDITNIIENGQNRYSIIGPTDSGTSSKTMTINWSASKFFSTKKLVGSSLYRGALASNPDEQAYLHLVAQPLSGVDSSDIRCMIDIEYITILSEPKTLAQS